LVTLAATVLMQSRDMPSATIKGAHYRSVAKTDRAMEAWYHRSIA
jgi:hypothetical protein